MANRAVLFHDIQIYLFQSHPWWGLTVLTLIVALIFIGYYYQYQIKPRKAQAKPDVTSKFRIMFLTTSVIVFALASSYRVLFTPVRTVQGVWAILSPPLLFVLVLFLKILLLCWIIRLLTMLFKPELLSEFGAKFFGFEIHQKYNPQQIQDGLRKIEKQLDILARLNGSALTIISTPFERYFLQSENRADRIRQLVKDVLIDVYETLPEVKIYVIPFTDAGIGQLPEVLAAKVRLKSIEKVNSTQVENDRIGMSIHHGTQGSETVIIIDTTKQNYDLSLAEITAAAHLFVSMATILDWAVKSRT